MSTYQKQTRLEMFIKGRVKMALSTQGTLKTKCATVFNYEDGVETYAKISNKEYSKAIEFVRKNFQKAIDTLKKESKKSPKVNWELLYYEIEQARNGNELLDIIDRLPLENGKIE